MKVAASPFTAPLVISIACHALDLQCIAHHCNPRRNALQSRILACVSACSLPWRLYTLLYVAAMMKTPSPLTTEATAMLDHCVIQHCTSLTEKP